MDDKGKERVFYFQNRFMKSESTIMNRHFIPQVAFLNIKTLNMTVNAN